MSENKRRSFLTAAAALPAVGAGMLPTAAWAHDDHGRNEDPWNRRWIKTPASGMGDVTVGYGGRVWLAGRNGTIWYTDNGVDFTQVTASGFARVAAGPDGALWAVGGNGTLWVYRNGSWTNTGASGMGDVAVSPSGLVWLVGLNGTVWTYNGTTFTQIPASGFSRIAVALDRTVFAVGSNGTLWRYRDGSWRLLRRAPSDLVDVAISPCGRIWVTRKDGTIWFSENGRRFYQIEASGFESIAVGLDDNVWAVGYNGTLWKYERRPLYM